MSQDAKSIIITGAGSGIGKSCADLFLREGYRVGLVGRRQAPLEAVAEGQPNALPLPCDVTDPLAVRAAFDRAYDTWGHIDVLFNNAGVSKPATTIDEISDEDWQEVLQINLGGTFHCAREAFRIMRAQSPQGGRIINNGSVSSYVPPTGISALYQHQTRSHRPHPHPVSRRPPLQHRLRPDRYRQCTHRNGTAHDRRRAASGWIGQTGSHHGRRPRRIIRPAHGRTAARCQRSVHDRDGDDDALYRARLNKKGRPFRSAQRALRPGRWI